MFSFCEGRAAFTAAKLQFGLPLDARRDGRHASILVSIERVGGTVRNLS